VLLGKGASDDVELAAVGVGVVEEPAGADDLLELPLLPQPARATDTPSTAAGKR